MKTFIATSVMTALLISGVAVMAQDQKEDYLGLPGDNLNLYAVMKLFQESKTLEEFERNLNDENSRINNLDLNGDNMIDYINVFDNVNGNVHNIVLQVAIDNKERQDVAVFTVDRDKKGNVLIQLTGDEELYGQNYIIEPNYDESVVDETPNPGYTGNAASVNGRQVKVVRTTVVEVSTWPLITYIYAPGYVVWRSSWYWGYYPPYWRPWRPFYWHYYYGYHYNWYDDYYAHYRLWHHHRHDYWHEYYYRPHHQHSATVNVYIREGHYKPTYSRPEERSKGEALYTSTHRDSPNRRTESVRVADPDRRANPQQSSERKSEGAVNSSRRGEGSTTTRAEDRSRPSTQVRSSEGRSSTQVRSSEGKSTSRPAQAEGRSSQVRSTESKSASPARTSESRPSTQVRAAEQRSRESSARPAASERKEAAPRASAPQRRESKPAQAAKKESAPKSKESSEKKEIKSESKRR
jgi:hypothetical protein